MKNTTTTKIAQAALMAMTLWLVLPVNTISAATRLNTLRSIYEKNLASIIQEHTDSRMDLRSGYVCQLDKLVESHRRAGNLDAVLLIQMEKQRFQKKYTLPAAPKDGVATGLARVQKQCLAQWRSIQQKKHQRILRLVGQYNKHLSTLEKRLTYQGKIEDAVSVHSERESVKKSRPVKTATFALTERGKHRQIRKDCAGSSDAVLARKSLRRAVPVECRI